MDDEPELYIFRPAQDHEWHAERERQRAEARRRQLEHVAAVLVIADMCTEDPRARAEAVLDGIFLTRSRESGDPCRCSCHPQLPETDLHAYGSDCQCRLTREERTARWDQWQAENDAYWESAEGRAITAAEEAEKAELAAWIATQPGVIITRHGGYAPEQWEGAVDGHSFYFRERHGHWRIELDLVPNGHFVEVWRGGDLDDDRAREMKELESGTVIAEGALTAPGYGETPLQRALGSSSGRSAHISRSSSAQCTSSCAPTSSCSSGAPSPGARLAAPASDALNREADIPIVTTEANESPQMHQFFRWGCLLHAD